jgi:sugar O-acyltransferase (sialic acid O-acetyltransferase NeuD family)
MTVESIWLIGAGGHAKVVIATLESAGLAIAGVFDGNPAKVGTSILGRRVNQMPERTWWAASQRLALLAIGANEQRAALAPLLPTRWSTAVHPTAIVHPTVTIGPGTLVCAGVIIQPDVRIGAHAIVNTGAIVEHDCQVGDYCHLAPRSCCAGAVTIGNGVFLGAGAVVIPEQKIGDGSIVGAGAVVIRPIPPHTVVAGVPARRLSAVAPRG